jgi:hypothetical protein
MISYDPYLMTVGEETYFDPEI